VPVLAILAHVGSPFARVRVNLATIAANLTRVGANFMTVGAQFTPLAPVNASLRSCGTSQCNDRNAEK
jgi:hypothetical protein